MPVSRKLHQDENGQQADRGIDDDDVAHGLCVQYASLNMSRRRNVSPGTIAETQWRPV
jgi:hypothetical protein